VDDDHVSAEGLEDDELILYPTRTKWLLVLLVCAAFLAFALLMSPERQIISWVSIVGFGLGGLVSIVALLPGSSYLRLSRQGYEQRAFFRTSKQSWQHIERFQARKLPTGLNRFVGFNFDLDYPRNVTARRVNRSLTGADAGLADTYGLSADELAKLMNEWLNRYKHRRSASRGSGSA
jgi:hypothetical protein